MIAAVAFALKYLPLIVAAVQFVQNFADANATGEARKALATGFVVKTLKGLNVPVNARTEEIIGILINLAVTVLNSFGIFESKDGSDLEAVVIAAPVARETRVIDEQLDAIEAILVR